MPPQVPSSLIALVGVGVVLLVLVEVAGGFDVIVLVLRVLIVDGLMVLMRVDVFGVVVLGFAMLVLIGVRLMQT